MSKGFFVAALRFCHTTRPMAFILVLDARKCVCHESTDTRDTFYRCLITFISPLYQLHCNQCIRLISNEISDFIASCFSEFTFFVMALFTSPTQMVLFFLLMLLLVYFLFLACFCPSASVSPCFCAERFALWTCCNVCEAE